MKRRKKSSAKRNPIAKAARKIHPQVVPNRRRKKLERAKKREAEDDLGGA